MPRRTNDLSGRLFGRLTVNSYAGSKRGNAMWECTCSCGAIRIVIAYSLLGGTTKSCGCLSREIAAQTIRALHTHEASNSSEYQAWINIKDRCYNPSSDCYGNYGGRGIRMCDEWVNDFTKFYGYVGPRPPGLTLDRIDNNGNYEPGNVRWATRKEQQRNRRTNRNITFSGATKTVAEWAEIYSIRRSTLGARLAVGLTVEDALTMPLHRGLKAKGASVC